MSDPSEADVPWAPQLPPGRVVDVPGRGKIFLRELAGPDGAPTVFLLHGWTATADLNWFPVFETLAQRFRVVAFDHRGHGRGIRSWRRFRFEDCADDVAAVADMLEIDRFIVAGYSMGGPIATLVWRRHPTRVQALVLCATACRFGPSRFVRAQLALFSPLAITTRVLPTRMAKPAFSRLIYARTRDGELQPWVVDEILSGEPRHVLEAGAALHQFDSRGWIGDIDVPTAVLVTDDDRIVPTAHQDEMVAALGTELVVRIEGGHDVCVRHPGRFTRALVAALEAIGKHTAGADPEDAGAADVA